VGILLVAIFGYISLRRIPIQMKPTVDKPIITVSTVYRGAAPQEVEEQITTPIEEQLQSVENLHKISSRSSEGISRISLEFDWGVDKDIASINILKKLNLVGELPEEAETPIISAITSEEEQPIMWLIAQNPRMDINALYQYGDDYIKPQLERLPGVGQIRLPGGEEREIQVILDYDALSARGISISEVRDALRRENRNVRGGHFDEGKRRFTVRTVGLFQTLEDIEQVVIRKTGTEVVYVRDIARVVDSFKEKSSAVKANGKPTIAFGIIKKTGANTLQVIEQVKAEVEKLQQQLAPKGITLEAVYDESEYIWDSVNFVVSNLKWGALLASLVLIFFLKSLRSTIIVALAIPISVVAVFIPLLALGRSLNIISLAGLAFAVGMVVDNAIVVLENIYRQLEMGKSRVSAAFEGTYEVWGAVLAATLTTLAVFLPIIFVKEEAGQLFKDIAIAISCAVGFSLVVSITVIPMLSSQWLRARDKANNPEGHKWVDRLLLSWVGSAVSGFFLKVVSLGTRGFKRKIAVILIITALFWLSLKLTPKREYLPTGNRNFIIILLKPHTGTNLARNEYLTGLVEEQVSKLPEVERYFSVVSPDFKIVGVICKRKYSMQIKQIAQKINRMIFGIPGFEYAFATQVSLFGRRLGKGLDIDIRGLDFDRIQAYAAQIQQQVRGLPGVQLVRSSLQMGQPEIQVRVDREKAADLGLAVQDVAEIVETLVAGKIATLYKIGGNEYDITLKGPDERFDRKQALRDLIIYTPSGRRVTLTSIAEIREASGPTSIDHIELDRSITLTVNIAEEVPLEQVMDEVNNQVLAPLRQRLPYGYSVELSGTASDLETTAAALRDSFILAVIIIYLLMSSLFESFIYPFIIMFSVPLAATGAILGVYLTHSELNVVTMLGFIILAGIVVNNAILLIHQALHFMRRDGMEPNQAIIESTRTRIRPIFMSVITTVCGMLLLTFRGGAGSELYSGLGAAIVGGLSISTVFTLILVPVVFSLFVDLKRLWGKAVGQGQA
jgi:HAE1 family hydrophobic/amphiphilic exporter-1